MSITTALCGPLARSYCLEGFVESPKTPLAHARGSKVQRVRRAPPNGPGTASRRTPFCVFLKIFRALQSRDRKEAGFDTASYSSLGATLILPGTRPSQTMYPSRYGHGDQ
jgi:hypothetical protein